MQEKAKTSHPSYHSFESKIAGLLPLIPLFAGLPALGKCSRWSKQDHENDS